MNPSITVNGKPRALPPGLRVADLVQEITGEDDPQGVAIAINGAVIRRGLWTQTLVQARDEVEILHAVSGG